MKAGTATVGVWLSRAQRRMIGKGKRARATLLLRTHSATGVSETRLRVTLR